MDQFGVIQNLKYLKVHCEKQVKTTTDDILQGMWRTKVEALKQAITDQKELKYYGGVKNLIDMAKKGAETNNLFNDIES
jgi:hypothetical protein